MLYLLLGSTASNVTTTIIVTDTLLPSTLTKTSNMWKLDCVLTSMWDCRQKLSLHMSIRCVYRCIFKHPRSYCGSDLSGQTIFSAAFYLRIPYRLDLFVAKLFHNKHIKLDVCLNFLLSYPLLRFVCSTKSDNCFLPYSITMITTRAFHMSSGWVWTHCRTSWIKMSAAHFTTSFMLSCEMGSHRDNNGIFNANNRV